MILTPFSVVTTSPARLPSTLPAGLDRKVDDHRTGRQCRDHVCVSRIGALRPGISAVQITMSVRFSASVIRSRCRR